uniref:DinB family protein n=1 Tax=Eiseniibacteriota bacterium TaxID=2212470 RepID=A0A832MNA0_UNCEI
MPGMDEAIRYANDPATGEAELRRACEILELPADGDAATLRARLRAHLASLDAARPVVCLNPGPLARRAAGAGPRLPRPAADEHAPVFADEIALVPDAPDFAALLEAQLDVTRALATTFGEAHAGLRYAPDRWSVRESLGHLADCERVLSYRLLRVLRGDATPLPGFDHVAYVASGGFERRSLATLVHEFAAVRAATVALVRSAAPADFARRVPVGSGSITGTALAYVIAGHERQHQRLMRERYLPCLPAREEPGAAR